METWGFKQVEDTWYPKQVKQVLDITECTPKWRLERKLELLEQVVAEVQEINEDTS